MIKVTLVQVIRVKTLFNQSATSENTKIIQLANIEIPAMPEVGDIIVVGKSAILKNRVINKVFDFVHSKVPKIIIQLEPVFVKSYEDMDKFVKRARPGWKYKNI